MALCTSSTGSPKKPMSVHASPTPVMPSSVSISTITYCSDGFGRCGVSRVFPHSRFVPARSTEYGTGCSGNDTALLRTAVINIMYLVLSASRLLRLPRAR